jgi:hypothetical protein
MLGEAKVEQVFCELKREQKIQYLLRLGSMLTVVGREAYEPQTENLLDPPWLREVNEIQHRILGYLVGLTHDGPRYPDDILIRIVLEGGASNRQLRARVLEACLQCLPLQEPAANGTPARK